MSTRKNKGGRNPGITTAEVLGKLYKEDTDETTTTSSLFHPPKSKPTMEEEKIVLSQVLKVAILAILRSHSYQWNKEVRLQGEGAPIGLELAGALARVVMLWWDKKFLELTAKNNILFHLYKRYVDDQNMAGKPLQPGTRWKEGPWANGLGKMVLVDEEVNDDKQIPASVRTMSELRKMADSIIPMIQLEEDHPENHDDRKIPILDLKVWVAENDTGGGGGGGAGGAKLRWMFYRKPMSNRLLIPAESAMAISIKRTALTQYGLRILRNTSLELDWDSKAEMLSDFCSRMRDSGYGQKFRAQIIESVLRGWDKMLDEQERGGRPVNRPRQHEEAKRKENKWRKRKDWYKAGGFSTVLFCPWTPGSQLAKKWREIERQGASSRGWRYKIVEKTGRAISSIVCKNPWTVGPCEDEDCFVCSTGGRGPCGTPGCNYTVQCMTCKQSGPTTVPRQEEDGGRPGQGVVGKPAVAKYFGESGYSCKTRGSDHDHGLEKKDPKNPLWRHCLLYHSGNQATFSMSVTAVGSKPYERRLREGVEIVSGNEEEGLILLNSRSDFLQGAVPHTRVARGLGA